MAYSKLNILVPLEDPGAEEALVRFAATLAQTRKGELHLTHIVTPEETRSRNGQQLQSAAALAAEYGVRAIPHLLEFQSVTQGIQETVRRWKCNMMVMGWYHKVEKDAILAAQNRALTKAIGVDTLIFKDRNSFPFQRLLVPSGGGSNALMGIQIASELARDWNIPIEILRVVRNPLGRSNDPILQRYCTQLLEGAKLQLELLGVEAPIRILLGKDVATSVAEHTQEGDLVVLGASNDWRQEEHLAGSIPDEIANQVPTSVLMVRSLTPNKSNLSQIFWENTIRLNLHPKDKWDAITQMVDALVEERQVPSSERQNVLDLALERERESSTSLGHETAIPHAPIPDLPGIIGCLGICPDGVDFGGIYDDPVRCIFLLLTPQQNYLSYIPVLAQIATFMKPDPTRAAVLRCQTPSEVTSLIKQQENAGSQ
jgi:mannitol/fructose-specific phosphotransferase system IIA component (Ntr-type)/nucleotide-binding universal stress UspA family protein